MQCSLGCGWSVVPAQPGPCPVQIAAIHDVRKRDMEMLVKKMKSRAEREGKANQVSLA